MVYFCELPVTAEGQATMEQNLADLLKEFELQWQTGEDILGDRSREGKTCGKLWKKLWREIRLPSESPSDCSLTCQPYSTVQFVELCYLNEKISDLLGTEPSYIH